MTNCKKCGSKLKPFGRGVGCPYCAVNDANNLWDWLIYGALVVIAAWFVGLAIYLSK